MLSKYDLFLSNIKFDFLGLFDFLRADCFFDTDYDSELSYFIDWFFEKLVYIPHHFDVSFGLHDDDLPF